jgi:hypothetical protein
MPSQHFFHGDRSESRRDLQHALLELGRVCARELVTELAEDSNQHLSGAGRVDVGEIEHGPLAGHAEDLIFDAQRALEIGQIVGKEQVAFPGRDSDHDGADPMGLRELGDARHHLDELARIVVHASSHLCFDHNRTIIDPRRSVLKG